MPEETPDTFKHDGRIYLMRGVTGLDLSRKDETPKPEMGHRACGEGPFQTNDRCRSRRLLEERNLFSPLRNRGGIMSLLKLGVVLEAFGKPVRSALQAASRAERGRGTVQRCQRTVTRAIDANGTPGIPYCTLASFNLGTDGVELSAEQRAA